MDFFRKVFRSRKRSKTHSNHEPSIAHQNGYSNAPHSNSFNSYNLSQDDAFLPPRFPEANTNRPMTAPSTPTGAGGAAGSFAPYAQFNNTRRAGPSALSRLPDAVLDRIFSYVCPHSGDHSYLTSEEAAEEEEGCMLCEMRDLARCGSVCRRWNPLVERLQYTSIRLDSVHFCGLEEQLQTRRNRGSFFQKKHEPPMDVPEMRMRLLYRTLQENERIAFMVQFLKMPYMTRETCKADLARLVSLTPDLKYCDVPEGVFSDDASCAGLKAILYSRCPELRKMTWAAGSEKNFVDLWAQPPWRKLEVLNLVSLKVENADLVRVLNSLPALHDLTLKALPWVSDAIFDATPNPNGVFPALSTLRLEDIDENVTLEGLKMYLSRPLIAASLTTLSLTSTSVPPQSIPALLSLAPALESLTLSTTVTRALQHPEPPHLRSSTLKQLHYELTSSPTSKSLASPTPSYYAHLATSLLSSSLPSLTALYVRESDFVDRLAGAHSTLRQPLTIHTKSADHLDWSRFLILPAPRVGGLEVRALWEMPRNSLAADFSDPRMSGFFKAVAAGEWNDPGGELSPPTAGFKREAMGERPGSRGAQSVVDVYAGPGGLHNGRTERSGSIVSLGGLGLPQPEFSKKEKRRSRQDIWR